MEKKREMIQVGFLEIDKTRNRRKEIRSDR